MGLKGFAIVTFAIVGIIFTFTSIMSVIVPLVTLKYHLAIELKQTYDYNNAQLSLLGLVSKKHDGTYSMYRVLSEHTVNGFDENMQESLREKLFLLTNSNCSKIVNTTATVLEPENCEPAENTGEIFLFVPYNSNHLVEKIILVYS